MRRSKHAVTRDERSKTRRQTKSKAERAIDLFYGKYNMRKRQIGDNKFVLYPNLIFLLIEAGTRDSEEKYLTELTHFLQNDMESHFRARRTSKFAKQDSCTRGARHDGVIAVP
jgi:hypothetical protein